MEEKNNQEMEQYMDGLKQRKTSMESKCPICNDSGWVPYTDPNGYEYAKECKCGIIKNV